MMNVCNILEESKAATKFLASAAQRVKLSHNRLIKPKASTQPRIANSSNSLLNDSLLKAEPSRGTRARSRP